MSDRWPRFATTFLHRNISMLAVVFLVAHVATVVLDGFAPIGWKDAVVPFASAYRPLWLGFGAVAFDLVLALVVTSLLRNRIGPRTWRLVHWLAYVCWPFAVVHGLANRKRHDDAGRPGSSTQRVWWRCVSRSGGGSARRASTNPRSAVRYSRSPSSRRWPCWRGCSGDRSPPTGQSERAPRPRCSGTPLPLRTRARRRPRRCRLRRRSSAPEPASLGDDFEARYTGTISRSSGAGGQETLEFDTTLDDPSSSSLVIVLRGTDSGAGLVVQRGTATITSPGEPTLFVGDITSISGDTLIAVPTGDSASSSTLAIAISTLDNATQRVSGTVTTTQRQGAMMLRSRTASLTEPSSVIAPLGLPRMLVGTDSRAVRSRSPITSRASARCPATRRRVTANPDAHRDRRAERPPWPWRERLSHRGQDASRCFRPWRSGGRRQWIRGRAGELEGRVSPCPDGRTWCSTAPCSPRRRSGPHRLSSRSTEASRRLASGWPTRSRSAVPRTMTRSTCASSTFRAATSQARRVRWCTG